MKNYYIVLVCALTTCVSNAFCQTLTVLSIDESKPIPFAHVNLKNIETSKEKLFLTDTCGKINLIGLEKSQYIISISCIGYKNLTDTVYSIENKTYYLTPVIITMNEVVVTAQYAPNSPEKAVHKIKIIDSKKIEAMGAVNLRDVLTNELNIRLSQDNILGSSMSLQGLSGQNVKILIDGVPVTGRLNGNIDISQINMNNVERIEIIEGPLSVNYGTDALGGTINIITKKSQKETFSISSNNYYESNGQYNSTGRIGYNKGNNFISLSGGRNYFDGWRTDDRPFQIEKVRIADSLRHKNWKPKEQYFGTLNYMYRFKALKLGYTGDYFYEQVVNKGLPRLPYYETAFDEYYITNRINNSLNLTGQINKNYYVNVMFAHTHFKRVKKTYFKDLTTLNEVLTENPSDQDTSVFNNIVARGSISKTKANARINYEVGYDINHETALGLRIKNQIQQICDYAIFSSAEYKPTPKLIIRPGLRVIYNTAYKAPLVPSLNLKYSILENDKKNSLASIRFSYARGFRSPSIKELYFYFVDINHNITGNENLEAEQSHNFNLSTSFSTTKNDKVLKTELSMFYNYMENMISLAQSSGTEFSYFNIDRFQTLGIQLQNDVSIKHFKISIGGAYIGRYNRFSNSFDTERFLYSPEGRCNLFYEWHEQKMTFALFYKYTGVLPAFGVNNNNEIYKTSIQDFHIADMSVSKLFLKKSLNLTLGIKNIFDVKNITGAAPGGVHSSGGKTIAVGMGRTYFMKLDINLNSKN